MDTKNLSAPSRTEHAPDAPLPRAAMTAKTVSLILGIIIIYIVFGDVIFGRMQLIAEAMAHAIGVTDVSLTYTGIMIVDVGVDLRLYWVTAALTLIGVSALIFRAGLFRGILATVTGVAIIVIGYLTQTFAAVALAAGGVEWADMVTSGSIAFIVAMLTYLTAFVVQMQLMLVNRT